MLLCPWKQSICYAIVICNLARNNSRTLQWPQTGCQTTWESLLDNTCWCSSMATQQKSLDVIPLNSPKMEMSEKIKKFHHKGPKSPELQEQSFSEAIFDVCNPLWMTIKSQQVLNPTPLNPAPATCHRRKRKLRCSFRNAVLQKLHCNIGFSQCGCHFDQKSCAAAGEKLQCNIQKAALQEKVPLSCRFPADFKLPRLGTHV